MRRPATAGPSRSSRKPRRRRTPGSKRVKKRTSARKPKRTQTRSASALPAPSSLLSTSSSQQEPTAAAWQHPEDRLSELSLHCISLEERREFAALVDCRVRCAALARVCTGSTEHPLVQSAQVRLAQAYLLSGLTAQAVEHAARVEHAMDVRGYDARVDMLDEDELALRLNVSNVLGSAYLLRGAFKDSCAYFGRSLELSRRAHGRESVENCPIMASLAEAHTKLGEYATALELLFEVWELKEKQLGANHVEMVPVYLELAKAYFLNGEDTQAQENAEQVIVISDSELENPNTSAEVGDACYILASSLKRQGEYEASCRHWERALTVFEQLEGPDSMRVQGLNRELATTFVLLEDYPSAADRLRAVLRAQRRTLHHSDDAPIGQTYKRLGEVHLLAGQNQEALEAFRECMVIFRRQFGRNNAQTRDVQRQLQALERQENDRAFMADLRSRPKLLDHDLESLHRELGGDVVEPAQEQEYVDDFEDAEAQPAPSTPPPSTPPPQKPSVVAPSPGPDLDALSGHDFDIDDLL